MARMTLSSTIFTIICITMFTVAAHASPSAIQGRDSFIATGPLTDSPVKFDWLEVPTAPAKAEVPRPSLERLGIVDCRIFDRIFIVKDTPLSSRRSTSTPNSWSRGLKQLKSILLTQASKFEWDKTMDWARPWHAMGTHLNGMTSYLRTSRVVAQEYLDQLKHSHRQRILDLVDARTEHPDLRIRFRRVRNEWVREVSRKNPETSGAKKSDAELAKIQRPNMILISFPACKDMESVKQQPEEIRFETLPTEATEDAYWQYYGDCDYWKVDFTQPAEYDLIAVQPNPLDFVTLRPAVESKEFHISIQVSNLADSLLGFATEAWDGIEDVRNRAKLAAHRSLNFGEFGAWAETLADSVEFFIVEY